MKVSQVLTAPLWLVAAPLWALFWLAEKLGDPMIGHRCDVCGSELHRVHPGPKEQKHQ